MKKQKVTPIFGYKGFDKNLKCRDMQYEVGKTYKMEQGKKLKCCPDSPNQGGLHFCENPLDVFNYYTPADSRFATVKSEGDIDKHGDDSKVATSKLHIEAEISLGSLLKSAVKFILDKVKWDDAKESNTGYQSAATNTGYQSAATNTGYQSAATNTGYQSAATNTGYRSAATNTGYQSAATNTGNRSAATVEGKESVAISIGIEGKAMGKKGCWIVLSEWEQDANYDWHRNDVKSFLVDGEMVKEDVFYILSSGQLKEVND